MRVHVKFSTYPQAQCNYSIYNSYYHQEMRDLSYKKTVEANSTEVEKKQPLAISFCLSHAAEAG